MKKLLQIVMDIGEEMLLCGAEINRVEESICRMCNAQGAKRTDVFTTTSSMVVTLYDNNEPYTQTRRIAPADTNIERIHLLNNLSRKISNNSISIEDAEREVNDIRKTKKYPFWTECLAYAMIIGGFTIFFGGSFIEGLVSLIIGCIGRFVVLFIDKTNMSRIFSKFICSLLATVLSYIFVFLDIIENVDMVMIGNIMVLIPAIGLTNALRDLLTGHSIAGTVRIIESVTYALAIAAGFLTAALFLGGLK